MSSISKGINQQRARELNRALVLNILSRSGVVSRAELARKSHLRQATITNITKELITLGYVRETGFLTGKGGRRSVGLTIDESKFRIIAARLTREYFTVGLFTMMGTELAETRRTVSVEGGPEKALDGIAGVVNRMADEAGRENVIGFGLAVPGPFSQVKSHILLVTGFPGWDRISLREKLEQRIDLPLVLAHDAKAAAVAEWSTGIAGAGKFSSMLWFAGGQSVDAGIIIDEGQLLRGSLGTAGEIGHHSIRYDGPQCECGNRGCLEMYCSTWSITRRYQEEKARRGSDAGAVPVTFRDIARLFRDGEEAAVRTVMDTAGFVATGLANMVNLLNPDLIVLGDEITALGDRFVSMVREKLQSLLIPEIYESVVVEKSAFGEDASLRGMAMIVSEETLPLVAEEA